MHENISTKMNRKLAQLTYTYIAQEARWNIDALGLLDYESRQWSSFASWLERGFSI